MSKQQPEKGTTGHLGQKKARSEKRSEEKMRHMGDSAESEPSKRSSPKHIKDQTKGES